MVGIMAPVRKNCASLLLHFRCGLEDTFYAYPGWMTSEIKSPFPNETQSANLMYHVGGKTRVF